MKFIYLVFTVLILGGCARVSEPPNLVNTSTYSPPIKRYYGPKDKLTVLNSSFSDESRKKYPQWIEKMEEGGYGNAVWQELEDILYDSGRFDLIMEPAIDSKKFRQIISAHRTKSGVQKKLSIDLPDTVLEINVNFFKRETKQLQGMNMTTANEFHATVHLRYYDLQDKYINRPVPATGDAVSQDLLQATRTAARNAANKLLQRIENV